MIIIPNTTIAFFDIHYDKYEKKLEGSLQRSQGLPLGYGIKIDAVTHDEPSISEIQLLSPELTKLWIEECGKNKATPIGGGGLCLVYVKNRCFFYQLVRLKARRLDVQPEPEDFQKAARGLYFSSDGRRGVSTLAAPDLDMIIKAFMFPSSTVWMCSSKSTHFQRYSIDSGKRVGECLIKEQLFSRIEIGCSTKEPFAQL